MSSTSSVDYWSRTRELGFALPRCADCGAHHFYPKPACPQCGSLRVQPAAVEPVGTVYSFSVVRRAPSAEFEADVPYVVAIIATQAGPHLMARVVDTAPETVRIGMRVRVVEGRAGLAPVFRPLQEAP